MPDFPKEADCESQGDGSDVDGPLDMRSPHKAINILIARTRATYLGCTYGKEFEGSPI